jgi:hypothetical protein
MRAEMPRWGVPNWVASAGGKRRWFETGKRVRRASD